MKRQMIRWLPVILMLAVLCAAATQDVMLRTRHAPWYRAGTIDATAAAADVALATTERSYALNDDLDNVVVYTADTGDNGIMVRFVLGTNNYDVDIDIWVASQDDDQLTRVCTLDVVAGQQTYYGNTGEVFADTCNISNNTWLGGVRTFGGGTDLVIMLEFDLHSFQKVLFHGYGTFDGDTIVEVRGY